MSIYSYFYINYLKNFKNLNIFIQIIIIFIIILYLLINLLIFHLHIIFDILLFKINSEIIKKFFFIILLFSIQDFIK